MIGQTDLRPRRIGSFRCAFCMLFTWMFTGEIGSEPDLKDGFGRAMFFGLIGIPALLVVAFIISRIINTLASHVSCPRLSKYLSISTIVVIAALSMDSAFERRPVRFFVRTTHHPALKSMSNMRVTRSSTFGDGDAWFFRFEIAPVDLDLFIRDCRFQELPNALAQSLSKDRDEWTAANRLEDYIQRNSRELYVRPDHPRLFYNGDSVLITSEDHAVANLFIDHFNDKPIQSLLAASRARDAR